jgi:surface carbohydrate biosynthesis protein
VFNSLSTRSNRAGIYLDKGTQTINLTKWIHEKCESIFILDQELNPSIEKTQYNLGKNPVEGRIYPGTQEYIDGYFCVGPIVFNFAHDFFGNSDKIYATGWPRIDLQKRYATLIYSRLNSKLKKKYGDYLLFVSDFGVLTPLSEITQPQRVKALLDYEGDEFYEQSYADLQVVLNLLAEWDANPLVPRIIVRPHLVEDERIWKILLKGLKKTEVVQSGDITPWISSALAVVHRGSTVAIQAKLMGKKVFYAKDASKAHNRKIVEEISDYIVSDTDQPTNALIHQDLSKSKDELISRIIYNSRASAAENIVQILSHMVTTTESRISSIKVFQNYSKPSAIRRSFGLVRDELFFWIKKNYQAPQSKNLPGGIRRSDIKYPLIAIGKSKGIKIRRIGINLWELSAK